MEIKVNVPLVGRIGSLLAKLSPPVRRREETTETSVASGVIAFYYQKVKIERTRLAKYGDYIIMDEEYPEISTALDLYADNAVKEKALDGDPIEIKSDDVRVKNMLTELYGRTRLQENLWDTVRNVAKMGDEFDEVVVGPDAWIERLKGLDARTIFKDVDEYGRDKEKPYVQKDETGSIDVAPFEPWQIVHWKNGGLKKMYGESILKPIRRVYKQLQLMEDGMVIGRLTRSHLRYKVLVDVEGMDKEEREAHVETVKKNMKKKRLMNPVTGQLETSQNPLSAEEDFFVGVTKESRADVAVLQGATNLGNIRDVEYFQNKLFTGLGPKSFFGLEKDVNAKATLTEQDIQFARRVSRLRKSARAGIIQVSDYQLILKGIAPAKGLYEIHFAPISMVDEMRKWTMEKLKAEVAKIYKADMSLLSDRYILKNFLGVPDDEIASILRERPAPPTISLPTKSKTASIRAAGATGVTTPAAPMVSQDGFHIATLQMMNLVETLKDLVDLELDR